MYFDRPECYYLSRTPLRRLKQIFAYDRYAEATGVTVKQRYRRDKSCIRQSARFCHSVFGGFLLVFASEFAKQICQLHKSSVTRLVIR